MKELDEAASIPGYEQPASYGDLKNVESDLYQKLKRLRDHVLFLIGLTLTFFLVVIITGIQFRYGIPNFFSLATYVVGGMAITAWFSHLYLFDRE